MVRTVCISKVIRVKNACTHLHREIDGASIPQLLSPNGHGLSGRSNTSRRESYQPNLSVDGRMQHQAV
jgi:hypothetical protein